MTENNNVSHAAPEPTGAAAVDNAQTGAGMPAQQPQPVTQTPSSAPYAGDQLTERQVNAAIRHSAATPWLIDLLAAIAMSGVVVFNAAGFALWVRIVFLVLLLVALVLETQYSADASARSDRFLMITLGGIVGGLILSVVVTYIGLALWNAWWTPWALFGGLVLACLVVSRIFRLLSIKSVEKSMGS